jgi:hypothetical protein
MMLTLIWVLVLLLSVGAIVWGAGAFANHLTAASSQLGISNFALALFACRRGTGGTRNGSGSLHSQTARHCAR